MAKCGSAEGDDGWFSGKIGPKLGRFRPKCVSKTLPKVWRFVMDWYYFAEKSVDVV